MDPLEWHSGHRLKCPVCLFTRGEHFDAYCPKKNGKPPLLDYHQGKDTVPLPGPEAPRGRYGIAIIYLPNGLWKYDGAAPSATCAPMQDNVGDSSVPINDHICPSCKNDKCSKTEVTCWKCGGKL